MKILVGVLVCLLTWIPFSKTNIEHKEENHFSIRKGFSTVKGKFNSLDFRIEMNENALTRLSGKAHVKSINTGNAIRDKHLQNELWFHAETFPWIEIHSKNITKVKEGEYNGLFEITIKGKKHLKNFPFKIIKNNDSRMFSASFGLSISDYEVGGGFMNCIVGDEVTIDLNLIF